MRSSISFLLIILCLFTSKFVESRKHEKNNEKNSLNPFKAVAGLFRGRGEGDQSVHVTYVFLSHIRTLKYLIQTPKTGWNRSKVRGYIVPRV